MFVFQHLGAYPRRTPRTCVELKIPKVSGAALRLDLAVGVRRRHASKRCSKQIRARAAKLLEDKAANHQLDNLARAGIDVTPGSTQCTNCNNIYQTYNTNSSSGMAGWAAVLISILAILAVTAAVFALVVLRNRTRKRRSTDEIDLGTGLIRQASSHQSADEGNAGVLKVNHACERASVRACMHVCVRGSVRGSVRACVRACMRA